MQGFCAMIPWHLKRPVTANFPYADRGWERKLWPWLMVAAVLFTSAVLFADWKRIPHGERLAAQRTEAAQLMAKATDIIREYRLSIGIPIDDALDPNHTGLIGAPFTYLTTTQGVLTAKRTSTNPQFASIIVNLLVNAGLKPGDKVAVSLSGSFPALNIATLAACRVLELKPIIISSVGASSYGANIPNLTWPDMERRLLDKGILPYGSVAISFGGIVDTDGGLDGTGFTEARAAISRHGAEFLNEGSLNQLEDDILRRERIFSEGGPPRAFVNVGGPITSLGWIAEAARLDNGLLRRVPHTTNPQRGLIFRMFEAGIPVIHLLNIERLADRYGLPIDPSPLPAPLSPNTSGDLHSRLWQTAAIATFWLLVGGGGCWWALHRKARRAD